MCVIHYFIFYPRYIEYECCRVTTKPSALLGQQVEQQRRSETMTTTEPIAASGADLRTGPFSVLYNAVKGNTQVLVNVRNNHKLLGRVKAYDRHMNL